MPTTHVMPLAVVVDEGSTQHSLVLTVEGTLVFERSACDNDGQHIQVAALDDVDLSALLSQPQVLNDALTTLKKALNKRREQTLVSIDRIEPQLEVLRF